MNQIVNNLHELAENNDDSNGEEGFVTSGLAGDGRTQPQINPGLLLVSESSAKSMPRLFMATPTIGEELTCKVIWMWS